MYFLLKVKEYGDDGHARFYKDFLPKDTKVLTFELRGRKFFIHKTDGKYYQCSDALTGMGIVTGYAPDYSRRWYVETLAKTIIKDKPEDVWNEGIVRAEENLNKWTVN